MKCTINICVKTIKCIHLREKYWKKKLIYIIYVNYIHIKSIKISRERSGLVVEALKVLHGIDYYHGSMAAPHRD